MNRTLFRTILLTAMLLSLSLASLAGIIHVPADQPSIGAAIAAANDGDTILIADGTYNEHDLNLGAKSLSLQSESGHAAACILAVQGAGRGFLIQGGTTSLSDLTIDGGSSSQGGGVSVSGATLTLTNCVFSNNHANQDGGGLFINSSSVMVSNCTFTNDSCSTGNGGGIGSPSDISGTLPGGTLTVSGSTFTGCQGAAPAETQIIDYSSANGGGIFFSGTLAVSNSTFTGNSTGSLGGGIGFVGCGTATITNSVFYRNSAGHVEGAGGGGIGGYVSFNVTVAGCLFNGNASSGAGGGLLSVGDDFTTVTLCTFVNNQCTPFFNDPNQNLAGGSAVVVSPVFTSQPWNTIIANSIVWGNGEVNGDIENGEFLVIGINAYNIIPVALPLGFPGMADGGGNLIADPLFVRNPGTNGPDDPGDMHLQLGSPAINSGNNARLPRSNVSLVPISTDLDGNPRINLGTVDMGVYEYQFQNLPPIANPGPNQTVAVPHDGNPNHNTTVVTLDGSASSDPQKLPLTYQWTDQNNQVLGTSPTLALTRAVGSYTFTLTVANQLGLSASASVQVVVLPQPNQPPVADSQSVMTNENTPAALTLAGSDPDGDPISYQIVSPPQHGLLLGTAPNLFYVPAADFAGEDAFSFSVADPYGAVSIGSVNISITPVNQPPHAYDAAYSIHTNQTLSVRLVAGDADGDLLTYSILSGPSHGTLSGKGANRTYKPDLNFNGADTFTFKANDGHLDSNVATVTITVSPVNHKPKAVNDAATTKKGVAVTINVLANDTDPDGDPLTVVSLTQPVHGAAVLNADQTVTYTPVSTFTGRDAFKYTISDGRGGTAAATVTVTVTK